MALVLTVLGCAGQRPVAISSAVNYEGLAEVSRPYFDVAHVRPETVFSGYDGVIISAPELAFRTPDRSQKQFPLDDNQKRRFHARRDRNVDRVQAGERNRSSASPPASPRIRAVFRRLGAARQRTPSTRTAPTKKGGRPLLFAVIEPPHRAV